MLRRIIDYKKLDHNLASLLIDTYPYGYGDEDLITLKNAKGEIIEVVEIRTKDTIYLVKISKSLSNFISNFEENMEKELANKAPEGNLEDAEATLPELELNEEGILEDFTEAD